MPEITLDIETIPTNRQDVIDMLAESIKPPATYKKPDSIKQWLEENHASELDQAIRKTALDGAFGRVCCIGFAIDDDKPIASYGEEKAALTWFASFLEGADFDRYQTVFIGHNIAQFDIRFLLQRYMVNRIKPPSVLQYAGRAKAWESEKVFDTMVQWAGVGNRISLDKLCMALGVQSPKGEITGANVWDHYQAGNIEGIVQYCMKDIEATRNVYKVISGKE